MDWMPSTFTAPLSEDFVTDGPKLRQFVNLAWQTPEAREGFRLDDWQSWLLDHMLERYPEDHPDDELAGRLRYRQVVVSMGRQNGKSVLGAILGMYGLLLHEPGPQVIGIASNVDQAGIIYKRTTLVINQNPSLKKRFTRTTETRGIASADGRAAYHIKANKDAALQGIPVSLALVDELHLLKYEVWSALVLGTAQRDDGIVIGITTAGDAESLALKELYKTGHKASEGDPELERFGFFLWEAPEGAAITDEQAIKAANPSIVAGRMKLSTVLNDIKSIPQQDAMRYRLNRFVESSQDAWIEPWLLQNALVTSTPDPEGPVVFAIDTTPLRQQGVITASYINNGTVYSEMVAQFVRPELDELVDACMKLAPKAHLFVADAHFNHELLKRLKERGLQTRAMSRNDMAQASMNLYSGISTERIKIKDDQVFMAQSPFGIRRNTGDAWLISRRDTKKDIDCLLATAMGCYAAGQLIDEPILQIF